MLNNELLLLVALDTEALLANNASIVALLDVVEGITCNDPRKLNPTNNSVKTNIVQISMDGDDDDEDGRPDTIFLSVGQHSGYHFPLVYLKQQQTKLSFKSSYHYAK